LVRRATSASWTPVMRSIYSGIFQDLTQAGHSNVRLESAAVFAVRLPSGVTPAGGNRTF